MLAASLLAILPDETEAVAGDVNWPQANALLDRIEMLLTRGNMQVNTLFQENIPLLRSVLGQRLDELGRKVGSFDYEQALEILQDARTDQMMRTKP